MKKISFICFLGASILIGCKKTPVASEGTTDKAKQSTNSQPIQKEDLSKVSLDTKIGQMIMVGINDRKALLPQDELRSELSANKIGGIILFEKNISKEAPKETLIKLIQDLKSESSIPLMISIDEEGGKVHRLKEKYGFVSMPSAKYLGSLQGVDSTYFYAKRLAAELSELGITINFAPAVDVNLNPENAIIAKVERSYSENPQLVTDHAMAFIKAHHSQNVKTTLKHFPGHGSSTSDTHKGLVDVTKQWQFKELIPYKQLFDSGECDAIVSCHVINCHLDTTCVPSTLSKVITTEILRDLLGFKGVVFSDDMQMYAISKNYGLENAIAMAINAGVDVLVFGNNVNQTDRITATQMHAIIKKLVESGEVSEARINESYQRIMELKKKKW